MEWKFYDLNGNTITKGSISQAVRVSGRWRMPKTPESRRNLIRWLAARQREEVEQLEHARKEPPPLTEEELERRDLAWALYQKNREVKQREGSRRARLKNPLLLFNLPRSKGFGCFQGGLCK